MLPNELLRSTFTHTSQWLLFFVQENLKAVEVAQRKELDSIVKALGTLLYAQLLCKNLHHVFMHHIMYVTEECVLSV